MPMQPSTTKTRLMLMLVVIGLAAFANSFAGAFVFDDLQFLEHPHLNDPWRIMQGNSRPLHFLLLSLNHAWWGNNPWGYHLVNLVLHVVAGLALFDVLALTFERPGLPRVFQQQAHSLAWICAALWLVHPLQTESVTYIYQRTESMMGMCLLLTLACSMRVMTTASRRWRALAILFCLLGTLSKESMALAPLLVLLYDRCLVAGSWLQALRARRGLYLGLLSSWALLLCLILSGAGFLFQTGRVGFCNCPFTFTQQITTQPGVILSYLRLSVWPHPLCIDWARPAATAALAILLPGLVLLALLAATVWGLWRARPWSVAATWFFVTLAPTSSFLPMPDQMVEHRMYLPLAGVVVLIVTSTALGLSRLATRFAWPAARARAIGVALAGTALCALLFRTIQRNRLYHDPLALWQQTLRMAPHNLRARTNFAKALAEKGRPAEALVHFKRVYAQDPTLQNIALNLGRCLLDLNRAQEAVVFLQEQIARNNDPRAHQNLAVAYAQLGRLGLAHWHYAVAMEMQGNTAEAQLHYGKAKALGITGPPGE